MLSPGRWWGCEKQSHWQGDSKIATIQPDSEADSDSGPHTTACQAQGGVLSFCKRLAWALALGRQHEATH
jgi:hypothetical protein